MSLLSSTQGTPERVWSALHAAASHGGRAERAAMIGWLNPRFSEASERRPSTGDADGQTIGAAVSLDLLRRDGSAYVLTGAVPPDYAAFSDLVHDRLCSVPADDPDSVLLEVFAWMSTEIDARGSTAWTSDAREAFADAAEAAVGGGTDNQGERRFNSTKIAPWRRWMTFVGLAVDLPHQLGFQPYVAERLSRELARSGLPRGVEVPIDVVLRTVSERMPYADGGSLNRRALSRRGGAPSGRVSRLLSVALRDLHDEGELLLSVTGDATGLRELAPDPHPVKNVLAVVLREPTHA